MSLSPRLRAVALAASSALALSGTALIAAPADAAPDPRPVTTGADWLSDQLVGGLQQSSFGGPDVGLTIDTAMALKEVGGHATDLATIKDAIGPQVVKTGSGSYGYAESDEYTYDPTGPGTFIQKGYYASGVAKSLSFGENFGVSDIPAWAGTDLVADLESLVSTSAPTAGRLEDKSSFGDYASVLSQAYAANALHLADPANEGPVLTFLLQQQCSAGYFRLSFATDKSAADQTCDGGRASGQSPADPDVTSEVVRLLLPQAATNATVARRVGKAEAWLLAQQHADGSFNGGTATDVPNANSTGLAGWVLMNLGDDEAATRAAGWIREHQADEVAGCANGLTSATGAIGYDDPTVAAGLRSGLGSAASKWVRSTSQALPVLSILQTTEPALDLTGPTGYTQASRAAAYKVTGAVPGEKLCLTGGTTPVRVAADADGAVAGSVTLPAGTATRTITVTDRGAATDVVTTKVLGTRTLGVRVSKSRVKRGKSVTVKVAGLAVGERVTLRYRGKVVRTGSASTAGTFVRSIPVGRRLGKAAIWATGQFPTIRKGTTSIKVVR
jgi:hypothetical protein